MSLRSYQNSFKSPLVLLALAAAFLEPRAQSTGTMRNVTSMQIVQEMQVGWNLGNTLDAKCDGVTGLATETCWGNPKTTKAMFDDLKAKGFRSFRVPVTWENHFGGAPDYTIDKAWLDRVEEVVNYGMDDKCYVILNSHHDEWVTLKPGTKAQVQEKITKIWTQIANRFKNYGDHLIFETLNEPRLYGEATEWSGGTAEARGILNEYNAAIVSAMRATGGNNALRHIMVQTHAATALADAQNDLVLPPNDTRIIVSQHTYYPYYFTMDTSPTSTAQWGSATDKSEMDKELDRIHAKFVKNGIPVVIGEWGSIDKGNLNARVSHAGYYAKAVKDRGMCPVWWDNGVTESANSSFGLLNRKNGGWSTPSIADALVAPWKGSISIRIAPLQNPKRTMSWGPGLRILGLEGRNIKGQHERRSLPGLP
jgi:endoglucanase